MQLLMQFVLALVSSMCLLAVGQGQEPEQAAPLLSVLVPKIEQEHYKLLPKGDKYDLRIELDDGSKRIESVQLMRDDATQAVPAVEGIIENVYTDGKYTIVYEAGKDGYRARYYFGQRDEFRPIIQLAPLTLKTITG